MELLAGHRRVVTAIDSPGCTSCALLGEPCERRPGRVACVRCWTTKKQCGTEAYPDDEAGLVQLDRLVEWNGRLQACILALGGEVPE